MCIRVGICAMGERESRTCGWVVLRSVCERKIGGGDGWVRAAMALLTRNGRGGEI